MKVFYHGGCVDGFTSAWLVYKYSNCRVKLISCSYSSIEQKVLTEIKSLEKHQHPFYFLDLSASRCLDIVRMHEDIRSVIIDHHPLCEENRAYAESAGNIDLVWDTKKSSSLLTWNHFNPADPPPVIVMYVNDSDLYRHRMPGSREVNCFLRQAPKKVDVWDQAAEELESLNIFNTYIYREGSKKLSEVRKRARKLIKKRVFLRVGSQVIPAVESDNDINEICEELYLLYEGKIKIFAVFKELEQDKVVVSLRSLGDADVSKIAGCYGGGGHRRSSAFTIPAELFYEGMLIKG